MIPLLFYLVLLAPQSSTFISVQHVSFLPLHLSRAHELSNSAINFSYQLLLQHRRLRLQFSDVRYSPIQKYTFSFHPTKTNIKLEDEEEEQEQSDRINTTRRTKKTQKNNKPCVEVDLVFCPAMAIFSIYEVHLGL